MITGNNKISKFAGICLILLVGWYFLTNLVKFIPMDFSDVLFQNGVPSGTTPLYIKNSNDHWQITKEYPAEELLPLLCTARVDRAVPGVQNDILYFTDDGIFDVYIGDSKFSITGQGYVQIDEDYYRVLPPYAEEIWSYLIEAYKQ